MFETSKRGVPFLNETVCRKLPKEKMIRMNVNRMNSKYEILVQEVNSKSKGVKTFRHLTSHQRFKVHKICQSSEDLFSFSTGARRNRELHVVNTLFWDAVFPVSLPIQVLKNEILKRLTDERLADEYESKKQYDYWYDDYDNLFVDKYF